MPRVGLCLLWAGVVMGPLPLVVSCEASLCVAPVRCGLCLNAALQSLHPCTWCPGYISCSSPSSSLFPPRTPRIAHCVYIILCNNTTALHYSYARHPALTRSTRHPTHIVQEGTPPAQSRKDASPPHPTTHRQRHSHRSVRGHRRYRYSASAARGAPVPVPGPRPLPPTIGPADADMRPSGCGPSQRATASAGAGGAAVGLATARACILRLCPGPLAGAARGRLGRGKM